MKNIFSSISLCLIAFFFFSHTSMAQLPPTYSSADIFLQIKKLNVLGSVLYIAAHPDDENNRLLPFLAKEKLYRTAYLSLTRGDGGQNLIGSEQGIELGLIRTQELLAARRIDGCGQYFTRAFEFGFCKNAQEALRIWDKEKVLSDIVWTIRRFQPDVIITRFPGDERAGHGHHAASAILANEAYTAAADSTKFPEQFAYGVRPWKATRIIWNTYNFGNNKTTDESQFKMEVGGFNAYIGKSYGELAGESRTMHKSQGEGRTRSIGETVEYFATTGGLAPSNSLMDQVDTTWNRLGNASLASKIQSIIAAYQFQQPELSIPALIDVYKKIKQLPPSLWKNEKLAEVQQIIEACAGLYVEATTNQPQIVQGDSMNIQFFVNARKPIDAELLTISTEGLDTLLKQKLSANKNFIINKSIQVSNNKPISQPYWLENPPTEGMFDVRDQTLIGKAENDPAFKVSFSIQIQNETFLVERPIQYKYTDPVQGDVYQPISIMPPLIVQESTPLLIATTPKTVDYRMQYKAMKPLSSLKIQLPNHTWFIDTMPLMSRKERFFTSNYTIPKTLHNDSISPGFLTLQHFNLANKTTAKYPVTIQYNHIPTITYFRNALQKIVYTDTKTSGKKIGYLPGVGDKMPELLQQMGYAVTMLDEKSLTADNLHQFDAIITGIRAYNVNEYLTQHHDVLMNYVQNGGNLIAQYIKGNTVGTNKIIIGPYPFTVNSLSRVTEENAPVQFLLPEHPCLNFPNKISNKDFEGWMQERSIYQADQFDNHYATPLKMLDSGEKNFTGNGSLLITSYGKGNFVYTGLVFFRQLPAGVPGAYRLLANLIALPKH